MIWLWPTIWLWLKLAFKAWMIFTGASFVGFFVLSIIVGIIQDRRGKELLEMPPWLGHLMVFLHFAWLLPICLALYPLEWLWHKIFGEPQIASRKSADGA